MKNFWVTLIIGFIAGIVISGILFDAISYIGKSFNRVSVAWTISRAEKSFSNERFSDAVLLYEKALPKINPDNKLLYAKTKNNLALSIFKNAELLKNIKDIEKSIELFQEASKIYLGIDDKELAGQTSKNIQIAQNTKETIQ
ncbi:MAG: hypothetical protein WCS83_05700 [Endomicrobiia bacterium]|nr:hypothetical protein [Endomicrobiaceae bacterium]MDD3053523.1 hypothetical protein [Endomicrobiaceae bacterium]MDD3922485.1 hypothetical protein [Endomicrobiaceae bacterium]MDD5102451.1 hypothetical protein [Endomicrobiaceae bacterium]